MTLAVEAIDLRRTFTSRSGTFRRTRKDVEAVKGVSSEIASGELFGLLGPAEDRCGDDGTPPPACGRAADSTGTAIGD